MKKLKIFKIKAANPDGLHTMADEGKSGKFILSPTAGPYETELTEK